MAESIYVPAELYRNFVPGLFTIGVARKALAQSGDWSTVPVGSGSIPFDMISASLMVSSARFGGMGLGSSSGGKKDTTLSVSFNFFSVNAKPTAAAVKLLLVEYSVCFR